MGYTHYWDITRTFTEDEWGRLSKASALLIANSNIPVAFDYDEIGLPPMVTDKLIRFNGMGEDDGHETFYFANTPGWTFCKTARKPYDALVVSPGRCCRDLQPSPLEHRQRVYSQR
jgi:hypothetical protein